MRSSLLSLLFLLVLAGCADPALPVPKPRSFPKIEFPQRKLVALGPDYCHFDFQFPDYGKIEQKSLYFDEKPADPCWFDIYLPAFDGRIHFSYYPIHSAKEWEEKRDQAFDLAGYHNKRASSITEYRIDQSPQLGGMIFDIDGPAASPYQFFLTDSTSHFVRAALYFNTQAKPDSLRPIVDFVVADITKLIETFEWTK